MENIKWKTDLIYRANKTKTFIHSPATALPALLFSWEPQTSCFLRCTDAPRLTTAFRSNQERKCGVGHKDTWRRCSAPTPVAFLLTAPSAPASVSGPLRGTGLYCGSWPILSNIERNTPLRRPYRTSHISWDELAGRRTPCHSAAKGSVITSPSWRRPPFALPLTSTSPPCTGGEEENPPTLPTTRTWP
jgi:hypothetical protein